MILSPVTRRLWAGAGSTGANARICSFRRVIAWRLTAANRADPEHQELHRQRNRAGVGKVDEGVSMDLDVGDLPARALLDVELVQQNPRVGQCAALALRSCRPTASLPSGSLPSRL